MNKPIFHYGLHKELWDLLARNPRWSKEEAMAWLRSEGKVVGIIVSDCFACHAEYSLGRSIDASFDNTIDLYCCSTSLCPLKWANSMSSECGCTHNSDEKRVNLYALWREARNDVDRTRYAELIRDLPLSEAGKNLYTIV